MTGDYLMRNADKEFLREKQMVAYSDHIQDLLILEQKYAAAAEFLKKTPEGPENKAPRASELIGELDVAMNDVTQSKALVDIVGSDEAAAAAVTAIDSYGQHKGSMQWLLAIVARGGIFQGSEEFEKFEKSASEMREFGRDPFTKQVRRDLGVADP
ncbi:hypothetical protein ACFVGV_05970 [Pseudarthrobacter scleromae]|uniref:hypothetical protein n=1 Tax=Pseudarthrobacter scleromae TaxID=158897 RepID=UPI00362DC2F6